MGKQWHEMTEEERAEWEALPHHIVESEQPITVDRLIACLQAIKEKDGGHLICVNIAERDEMENAVPLNSVYVNAGGTVSIW